MLCEHGEVKLTFFICLSLILTLNKFLRSKHDDWQQCHYHKKKDKIKATSVVEMDDIKLCDNEQRNKKHSMIVMKQMSYRNIPGELGRYRGCYGPGKKFLVPRKGFQWPVPSNCGMIYHYCSSVKMHKQQDLCSDYHYHIAIKMHMSGDHPRWVKFFMCDIQICFDF